MNGALWVVLRQKRFIGCEGMGGSFIGRHLYRLASFCAMRGLWKRCLID